MLFYAKHCDFKVFKAIEIQCHNRDLTKRKIHDKNGRSIHCSHNTGCNLVLEGQLE